MIIRRAVVTGLGVVSPYGIGTDTFWENIAAGRSAARPIEFFDVSTLPTKFAAQLQLSDRELGAYVMDQKSLKTLSRSGKMAVIAASEAWSDAGLDNAILYPYRVGTSMGAGGVGLWDLDHSANLLNVFLQSIDTENGVQLNESRVWPNVFHYIHPLTPLKGLSNIPTAHIAIMTNARGHCQTVTTACTSSAQAIGDAYRQIKYGITDVIVAGGSDAMINPYGLVAFSTLGVMSTNNDEWRTAARLFDLRRDGFMLGEGAVVVILEEEQHCRRRGAQPYAEVIGYANTSDAYRLTDEPPDARGSIQAMTAAIEDAALDPSSITYVNAHGTGTKMNDRTETYAIRTVLGENAYGVPVSSTKSMIGHLVAAAGAIEFITCVLALKYQTVPPTINYEEPDDACDLDYVPNEAREMPLNVILSNSFGFGGQNACLLIRNPT